MSNVFRAFTSIFSGGAMSAGTVTAHNADGTSTISDAVGNSLIAQGQTVAVASKAFILDDRVQGEAPTLTETTVYV